MKKSNLTGILLASAATLGSTALLAPGVWAQAPTQAAGGVTVQRILVRGNQRIEAETVRSYLPVRSGQAVDQFTLDTSLKTLFATGLFADVKITLENGAMIVDVAENPIVNQVLYEGNKRKKKEKLDEEVQLTPRTVYTKTKIQADVQRIIEVYRRSGRFAATVTPKIVELPQNRVDIVFEIDEGPVTGVAKINFSGNEAFTSAELSKVMVTEESRWWKLFTSNDNYDPDRLEYDREQLRKHYTQNGYADFQVLSAVAELTPDRKDFFINMQVEEGPKYDFGKVSVKTSLSKVQPEYLERVIPIRTGTVFNSELIEKATEAITFATGISGYAFVDIKPRLAQNPDNKTVDIIFEVNEGPRVYVERINIKGNVRTLDRVVRREIRLAEGDAFNRVLVDRSERRVKSLGYFSEVEVIEEPGSAPDRSILEVALTEQSTGSFSVGAGVSSSDRFIANLSIEERNLLGRGQFLQLDARASSRYRQLQLSFREPYFLGRNLLAGVNLYNSRTDFREAGFLRDSLGGTLTMGFPVAESGRLNLNYALRNDEVIVDSTQTLGLASGQDAANLLVPGATFTEVSTANGPAVTAQFCDFIQQSLDPTCASVGKFLTSSLGYAVSFDQRNDPIQPSAGWSASLSQNFAGLGGDVKYLKTSFRGATYKRLPLDLIGTLKLDVGYVDSFGDDKVRLTDRFFKGASSFRGFDVSGVGPRLVTDNARNRSRSKKGQALGGKAYVVGSAEVLLPLPVSDEYGIKASLFTDFGTVGIIDEADLVLNDNLANWVDYNQDGIFDEPVQDDPSLRVTAGISINWKSPFGPVQIDIAEALIREDYDDEESFRFSAGGNF